MTAILSPQDLGARLRLFRRHRGLTVRDVAAAVHCSLSTIYYWEEGRIILPLEAAFMLAGLYHASVEDLVGENGPTVLKDAFFCRCSHCGHVWTRLVERPGVCPKCKDRKWWKER